MKAFDIQSQRLNEDECAINAKDYQNNSINDYHLWNTYTHKCDTNTEKNLQEFAVNHLNVHYRNGYGFTNSCHVNNDSELRYNGLLTNEKAKTQLFTRFYQANPNLGKGTSIPTLESRLVQGTDTSQLRQCSSKLAEEDFQRFTPLLPCLKEKVQDPNHIILPFTQGGDNSRIIMRNKDVLQSCGYKHDGKMWKRV